MANVLIPIADGCDEPEVTTLADLLRRGGLNVTLASVANGRKQVNTGAGGVLDADRLLTDCRDKQWDLIAVPGALAGARNLGRSDALLTLLQDQSDDERWLAASGAAPVLVLGAQGLVDGARATCSEALRDELQDECGANWVDAPVVVDGNLITGQGGATETFYILKLIELVAGAKQRERLLKEMQAG